MKVHKSLSQAIPEGYFLHVYHGYPSYVMAEVVLIDLAEMGDLSMSELNSGRIVECDNKFYICLKES
jgi:hypothetical protein